MTLAEKYREVSNEKNKEIRAELADQLVEEIQDHPEVGVLTEALYAAKCGKCECSLGRTLAPEILSYEGFKFRATAVMIISW